MKLLVALKCNLLPHCFQKRDIFSSQKFAAITLLASFNVRYCLFNKGPLLTDRRVYFRQLGCQQMFQFVRLVAVSWHCGRLRDVENVLDSTSLSDREQNAQILLQRIQVNWEWACLGRTLLNDRAGNERGFLAEARSRFLGHSSCSLLGFVLHLKQFLNTKHLGFTMRASLPLQTKYWWRSLLISIPYI